MTGYEATGDETAKSRFNLLTGFLNFRDLPKSARATKEDLLAGAWMMTGKHLRKAIVNYDQDIQEAQSRRNRSK